MSSKGRSTGETGHEFYPTPEYAITPLLDSDLLTLPGGAWVEPCVGTGNIVRAVATRRRDVEWTMYDIDERVAQHCPGAIVSDFLALSPPPEMANVVIMNPPFSLALDFAMRAMAWASCVVMLQRLNWFGSKKRHRWLQDFAPDVYALPKRPSFRPDKLTDSVEYAWFVWRCHDPWGWGRRAGMIAMLDMPRTTQEQLPGGSEKGGH